MSASKTVLIIMKWFWY